MMDTGNRYRRAISLTISMAFEALDTLAKEIKKKGAMKDVVSSIRKRNDLSKKITAIQEGIWDKSNPKQPQLIHRAVAKGIVKEFAVMAIEKSRSDWSYIKYDDEAGHWQNCNQGEIDYLISEVVGDTCTQSVLKSVNMMIRAYACLRPEMVDSQANLINLANTAFDLEKFKPVAHSPLHLFSHKNTFNYDPKAKCPVFTETLKLFSMGDEKWIDCLWEVFGYCMTGHYDYQYIFWMPGRAGNGKGTVTRVMENLVGDVFVKPDFNMKRLSDRFYKGALIGKRVAICGDMPAELANVHTIKQMSGGDRQSTDTKFGGEQNFKPTAKLVFAMNKYPSVPGGEPIAPLLRRIVLLPFDYTIKERDPDIEKKFLAEMPGIFNMAVKGLKRLVENKGVFSLCERGEKAKERWAGTSNTLLLFLEEACIIDANDKTIGCCLKDLWLAYNDYMKANAAPNWFNLPDAVRTTYQLSSELQNLGLNCENRYFNSRESQYKDRYEKHVKGTYPYYCGITLKVDEDEKAAF